VVLLHDRLATSILLFMVVVGMWGIVSFAQGKGLSGNLAGTFAIGQVLVFIQGVSGLVLYIADTLRDRDSRRALLFYSLIALFIAGVAVRGMATA
jgi:hypothetical protein